MAEDAAGRNELIKRRQWEGSGAMGLLVGRRPISARLAFPPAIDAAERGR